MSVILFVRLKFKDIYLFKGDISLNIFCIWIHGNYLKGSGCGTESSKLAPVTPVGGTPLVFLEHLWRNSRVFYEKNSICCELRIVLGNI